MNIAQRAQLSLSYQAPLQLMQRKQQIHVYSWCPLLLSIAVTLLAIGVVEALSKHYALLYLGILSTLAAITMWVKEADFLMQHTKLTTYLFIISEAALFLTLFISYTFASNAAESVWKEGVHIAYTNTLILILSGGLLHNRLYEQKSSNMCLIILLGVVFLSLQVYEYAKLSYGIGASNKTGFFYLATLLHSFHVSVGLIFLSIFQFSYHKLPQFLAEQYWHFVDYVWIVLFLLFYCL